ncbi:MAG: RNA 2'-phosphotransferase [Marivita lacus]|nr:RNA 2'-phosphotransferase [Marivita lacus]
MPVCSVDEAFERPAFELEATRAVAKQHRREKPSTLSRYCKSLARILRHEPEALGLKLDPQGWVRVDDP